MSVKDFQDFLLNDPLLASNANVVRTVHIPDLGVDLSGEIRPPELPFWRNRVAFVLDAETCLDRLYGGYFPDWSCGGQWRHMVSFLATIFGRLQRSNVQIAVCLNGSLEPLRFNDWVKTQKEKRAKVKQVLKHVSKRGTPPPKAFWVPPTALHTMLRIALRSLNIIVINSCEDHVHELMGFCWENGYHGVMSDNGEFALCNPPSYLSAHSIKLSLQFDITTKEVELLEVCQVLKIHPSRFPVVAALLGNHILSANELRDFHKRVDGGNKKGIIRAVIDYVKDLESIDDHDIVARGVFGSDTDERLERFKDSLRYYIGGSREGYKKSSKSKKKGKKKPSKEGRDWISGHTITEGTIGSAVIKGHKTKKVHEAEIAERIALDLERLDLEEVVQQEKKKKRKGSVCDLEQLPKICIPESSLDIRKTSGERHRQGQMSPYVSHLLNKGEIKLPVLLEGDNFDEFPPAHLVYRPLRQRVYAVLFNLHHRRYTLYNREKEARIKRIQDHPEEKEEKPPLLEVDDPEYVVHEWLPYNSYESPDPVSPIEVGWAVPTAHRLWFGSTVEDKRKRVQVFLSIMRCGEIGGALLQPDVPEPLLLMACVLRYLAADSKTPFIQKPELDAFLVTACSPELRDDAFLDELKLEVLTIRGIRLATLFMQGVEMALFANDSCGAPIPFPMCLPWMFFDGKLFHANLLRASKARNLLELCAGRVDIAHRVERMRRAIMMGLDRPAEEGHVFLNKPRRPFHMSMKLAQEKHRKINKKEGGNNIKKECQREDD